MQFLFVDLYSYLVRTEIYHHEIQYRSAISLILNHEHYNLSLHKETWIKCIIITVVFFLVNGSCIWTMHCLRNQSWLKY